MDDTRYKEAAELAGFAVPLGASLKHMRSIVAQRATIDASDVDNKSIDQKQPTPVENVSWANDRDYDTLSPKDQAWVKRTVLEDNDMPIHTDELEENLPHLFANGWYVVLKEKDQWHFRKSAEEPRDEVSDRTKLREEQDTAYAIGQVADYERERNEGNATDEPATTDMQPGTAGKPSGTVVVATAVDESDHTFKRRLVVALAMNHKVSVQAAHQFSHWIFESQEECTANEKRRFRSFWEANSGRANSTLEPYAEAKKPAAVVTSPEKPNACFSVSVTSVRQGY
jgi:hypothetical protein